MAQADAKAAPRRGVLTTFIYGLGSISFGVKDQGFGALLMLYYNQVLGLPASMVGAAVMIALITDAFIDPVIGELSDNWRSRWGRRHPFMYAAVIPASLSYLALWNPPSGLTPGQLFAYLLVTAIVIRSFISCYEVPSAALAPELTQDYDQRTSLLSVRYFFGWCGGLAMGIAAFKVFLVPDAEHPIGQLNPHGYSNYALAAAAVIAASMVISAAGTHRHIPNLAAPPAAQPFSLGRTLSEAKHSLFTRAFITILGSSACGAMGLGIVIGTSVYVGTYYWQLNSAQIAGLMLGNVISASAAMWIAPRLCKRFEKKKALVFSTLAHAVVGPAPLLLALAGAFPAARSPQLMPLLFAFSTASVTFTIVGSILTTSMMSDVVEDSQVATGRRSEGLFFAASAFTFKCVSGVGLGATGLVLKLANFPEVATPGQVPIAILERMVVLQVSFTALFNLLSILFAVFFPITRAVHEANLRKLGSKRDGSSDPNELIATVERTSVRSSLRPVG